jgi:hypothetical protein
VATVFILSCSCNNEQKKIDKKAKAISIQLKIVRFEQQLFGAAKNNELKHLTTAEKAFMDLYCKQILQISNTVNDTTLFMLKQFCANPSIKGLYDTVQKNYQSFNNYESQLQQAFQYHKFYLPKLAIPKIYTFISEFGYGAITADSILGIGLDMFLGESYPYYSSLGFPNFIIKKCTPNNLVVSTMTAWGQSILPEDNSKRRLIDKMIQAGKVMYYVDKVLPYESDSLKTGFTNYQLTWSNNNEFKIWEYFIKHNLLYTNDMMEIAHYVGTTPVTPGMPPDAPGNIGMWVGWQIVKKYIDNHPEMKMEQLMKETDGQKILEQSKYKPQKK